MRGYVKTIGRFVLALIMGGALVITWEPAEADEYSELWIAGPALGAFIQDDGNKPMVVFATTVGVMAAVETWAIDALHLPGEDGDTYSAVYTALLTCVSDGMTYEQVAFAVLSQQWVLENPKQTLAMAAGFYVSNKCRKVRDDLFAAMEADDETT